MHFKTPSVFGKLKQQMPAHLRKVIEKAERDEHMAKEKQKENKSSLL